MIKEEQNGSIQINDKKIIDKFIRKPDFPFLISFPIKIGGIMQAITISDIHKTLNVLPEDKLVVVYDFISYLASRVKPELKKSRPKSSMATLVPLDEYEQLKKVTEQKEALYDLARNLGRDVERKGITEKEFLAGIKQTKHKVFEKQYARIN
jgi:hypothetical protein